MWWCEDVGFGGRNALLDAFYFEGCLFWWKAMFVNRWCTFRSCLAHVRDLRESQVNVAMWSPRFNFVIWIASIKFQKFTIARKKSEFWLYFELYVYLLCGIVLVVINFGKVYEVHAFQTYICTLILICIWRNHSHIAAVSTDTTTHIEI